jgi:hypothetical protein
MPVWGWVLIGVGVVALGGLKLWFFGKLKAKNKVVHHDEDSQD